LTAPGAPEVRSDTELALASSAHTLIIPQMV
jgi:hypothetical protein